MIDHGVAFAAAVAFVALAVPEPAQSQTFDGGRIVLSQAAPRSAGAALPPDSRQTDSHLQAFQQLRSACGNAAWTLWHSNSYESWRNRKSPALSMNYSGGFFPSLPPAPAALPEALRGRLEDAMRRANDTLRDSSSTFKELANYINSKDYEDDRFRKGDELNTKLLALGRDCHGLYAKLTELYVETADVLIEQGASGAARPEIVAAMVSDWRRARELSRALAKGPSADMARVETLVREVSALAEQRKREFEAELRDGNGTLARFYDKMLDEDVAVKMRKLLRDTKANPKELQDAATDRPRSRFWTVRSEIDYQMPDAILSFIRQGK